MITELAVLDVLPGREDEFEAAFDQAKGIIASIAGFRSLPFWVYQSLFSGYLCLSWLPSAEKASPI